MKSLSRLFVAASLVGCYSIGCARGHAPGLGDARGAIVRPAAMKLFDAEPVLPRVPAIMPSPWMPLEVGRTMGAICKPHDAGGGTSFLGLHFDDHCFGPAPEHVAHAVLALPVRAFDLERDTRREDLRKAFYLAAPGFGRRPDFTLGAGAFMVRSFEGADPRDTVYLIWPVRCDEGEAGLDCRNGMGRKAFRFAADGALRDVSADVLPADPVLSFDDRVRQTKYGGSVLFLLDDKLPYAPTMRWIMEFDPDSPPLEKDDPKAAGPWAHFGFVHWTGSRFELVDRIARSQWPCRKLNDAPACSTYPDGFEDPFVIP